MNCSLWGLGVNRGTGFRVAKRGEVCVCVSRRYPNTAIQGESLCAILWREAMGLQCELMLGD